MGAAGTADQHYSAGQNDQPSERWQKSIRFVLGLALSVV
jgi:hypothetical protein